MKRTNLRRIAGIIIIYCLLLCGCGPTVRNAVGPGQPVPRRLAFLPIIAPEGMRDERVVFLRETLRRELANGGISLLNDEAIAQTCKTVPCPERDQLVNRYGAGGFFELTIESASKNNALLGYLDQIHGTARIIDPSGKELVAVENRETETSGLLFNSGQVLEGIKSSLRNYGDDGYNFLALKFAKTVALKLPQAKSGANSPALEQQRIDLFSVQTLQPDTYKICLLGTPGGMASINSGRRHFGLREISPGRYCGTHWIGAAAQSADQQPVFFGELRSPFGDVARKDVVLPLQPLCRWEDGFKLSSSQAGNEISFACSVGGRQNGESCPVGNNCPVRSYEVYRAPRAVGPYIKVAEVSRPKWTDSALRPAADKAEQFKEVRYQVVAVLPDGSRSKPFEPREGSGK